MDTQSSIKPERGPCLRVLLAGKGPCLTMRLVHTSSCLLTRLSIYFNSNQACSQSGLSQKRVCTHQRTPCVATGSEKMRLPRRVPWASPAELEQVCTWIYTEETDFGAIQRALDRVRPFFLWSSSLF
jgi:hypothetical protein